MKKLWILAVLLVMVALFAAGCSAPGQSVDQQQAAQQAAMLQQAQNGIGMPNIKNFQEKKIIKYIMEQRDRSDLILYAYVQSQYDGRFIYLGRCEGYGLPYDVEYTNPERENNYSGSVGYPMPQADPNGLFLPSSGTAGTWLMLITPDGSPQPAYIEPNVMVSPYKLPVSLLVPGSAPNGY
jgi:hypothetical protein